MRRFAVLVLAALLLAVGLGMPLPLSPPAPLYFLLALTDACCVYT
jgi:hypothetical protein